MRQHAQRVPQARPGAPTAAAAAGQGVHNTTARFELAALLGRDAGDLPRTRKTDDTPPKYSVVDVVVLIKGGAVENTAHEFRRLRDRYGDDCANCTVLRLQEATICKKKFDCV